MRYERPTQEDLRRSALFAGLPAPILQELVAGAEVAVVAAGQRLWQAGERPSRIGLVLSGQVKSVRRAGGREAIVDIALPGDVIGDVAFALDEPLLAACVGLQKARVLLVPKDRLRQAFQRAPRALASALLSVARRAERLQRQVERLSTGSVTQRLAATMVGLAERAGVPFPGGVLVPIRLRRTDLAALAATRPESVSRHLATWQREGLIQAQPAGYLVRDLERLRREAAVHGAKRARARREKWPSSA